jgi:hypothetical protein
MNHQFVGVKCLKYVGEVSVSTFIKLFLENGRESHREQATFTIVSWQWIEREYSKAGLVVGSRFPRWVNWKAVRPEV